VQRNVLANTFYQTTKGVFPWKYKWNRNRNAQCTKSSFSKLLWYNSMKVPLLLKPILQFENGCEHSQQPDPDLGHLQKCQTVVNKATGRKHMTSSLSFVICFKYGWC